MALVLVLKKGQSFYVGHEKLTIEAVHSNSQFTLRKSDGTVFDIIDARTQEVLPSVFVGAGQRYKQNSDTFWEARVCIEAPREIVILREDVYEESYGGRRRDGDGDGAASSA
jgi:hypothetical protein